MRNSINRWLLALGAASLLSSCAPSLFPTEMPVTASLSESGSVAALMPEQPLVVRLPANPSTGYRWSYTVKGDEVLRLDSVSGVGSPPNGMVGVPGDEVWSFRAQGVGRVVLTYVYTRPWEKHMAPAQTFTLTVVVKPAQ